MSACRFWCKHDDANARNLDFAINTPTRPRAAPPAGAKGELPFMNAMSQLDSGNDDDLLVERLEAGHRGTAVFGRAIVLLDHIVGILAAS